MAEKITLETLAEMIKKGFDENTEEHKKIFAKFDENTKEHQQIFGRFEKVDEKFEHIEARLDRIENDLSEIKENMAYKDKHEDLKCRVDLIEGKMGIVS